MRWVFLTLLILNALYFAWAQSEVSTEFVAPNPMSAYPQAGEPLTLLTEQSEIADRHAPAVERMCSQWGPFSLAADAQGLLQQLLSVDVAAQLKMAEESIGGDYWVYLTPQASTQASTHLLRELAARELEGHLIGEGDLRNGISLGLYAQRTQAEQVIERARIAGYTPYMRIVARTQKAYWVRVSADSQRLIDQAFIKRIEERFKGVTHQLKSC